MQPPDPPTDMYLEPVDWDGHPIDFYSNITFKCKNGMKFAHDFDLESLQATCLPGNEWIAPVWMKCVPSKPNVNVMVNIVNDIVSHLTFSQALSSSTYIF